MIDTSTLIDGDVCLVNLESEDGQTHYRYILCVFKNGVFQNIEEGIHTNEVYGSSVYKFKKIQTSAKLITILSDIKRRDEA